jgi:hypothetical protein
MIAGDQRTAWNMEAASGYHGLMSAAILSFPTCGSL